MLNPQQHPRPMRSDRLPLHRLSCAIALAAVLLGATGAGAEIFKKEDLLRGTTITHAQCDATAQTMWLNVDGRDFCVRYYLSTAGGEGARPVVILQGDQLGKFNFKSLTWIDTSDAKDVDTDDIVRTADMFSKMTKTTTIYLGRIGVDGTSGNHMMRGSQLELDLTGAALDTLKRRYGFEGFHLAGQSGGSKLVAGLSGLRRDIGCAVMGSPPLLTPGARKSSDQGRTAFEPSVSQLVQNRSVRLFAISDKADKRVPVGQQSGFIDKLHRAGRPLPQFFVEATDDLRHGVLAYTELVTAGCVLDRPQEEIAHALATLGKRNADYNERKRKESGAKASIVAAAHAPAPDASAATAGKK
jgi:hypothetical protein